MTPESLTVLNTFSRQSLRRNRFVDRFFIDDEPVHSIEYNKSLYVLLILGL